jgi:acetyltransferase-like isoleucine patch superfamily enzyme
MRHLLAIKGKTGRYITLTTLSHCYSDSLSFQFMIYIVRRVYFGSGTYGWQGITFKWWGETNAGFTCGRFAQIADDVQVIMGSNPCIKQVTSYPFFDKLVDVDLETIMTPELKTTLQKRKCPYSNGPVVIGHDVWIGMDVVLLSGVTVGDGAVLGANAVVRADVPPYAIVTGNPAQVVGFRYSPEQTRQLQSIQWWAWSAEKVISNMHLLLDDDIERFLQKHYHPPGEA